MNAMAAPSIAAQVELGLRRLCKTVVVITSWHDGKRWAMTATSLSEFSKDPPSLLICVDKADSLHTPLSAGANFCINILSADQRAVSRRCDEGIRRSARFAEGRWGSGACGSPYLCDGQASFFCDYETHFEHGSHLILIGAVKEVQISGGIDPLVCLDGAYGRATRMPD
ncbi:hypothetical protein BFL28_06025 [Sphingomonas turrisvirgatae]|uniref:Flavin reductase like domain-containing protein n=2 Tax=Sphingomonas turrisvirgatae TaxID=1888892 RepID=A0A1E3LU78_9SPHN|nr:hypothetical protein BFL28_06025 [Sphingomonas turrisvirgatae]